MSECMTQEDAERMDNEQAVAILKPLRDMMRDQNGCPISDAYFALDKAITSLLQPQRTKGKWIEQEDYNLDTYYDCSVCGESWCTIDGTPWDNGMNFCPNCGADMRGEQR